MNQANIPSLNLQDLARIALEQPSVQCAWVAPTYQQCRVDYYALIGALHHDITATSQSRLRITFANGSSIMFFDERNPERLRGMVFYRIGRQETKS